MAERTVEFMLKLKAMGIAILFLILILPGCQEEEVTQKTEEEPEAESMVEDAEEEEDEEVKSEDNTYFVSVSLDSSLFMRETPGSEDQPEGDVIDELKRNDELIVLDKGENAQEKDGHTWWKVYYPSTEDEGWVAKDYLSEEKLEYIEYDPEVKFAADPEKDDKYWYVDEQLLSFNSNKDEVIELLGEPDKVEKYEGPDINTKTLKYPQIEIHIECLNFNIYGIITESPEVYAPRNIQVGDSLESVIDKFPNEDNPVELVSGDRATFSGGKYSRDPIETNYRKVLYGDLGENGEGLCQYTYEKSGGIYYDENKEPLLIHYEHAYYGPWLIITLENGKVTKIEDGVSLY